MSGEDSSRQWMRKGCLVWMPNAAREMAMARKVLLVTRLVTPGYQFHDDKEKAKIIFIFYPD